MPFNIIGFMLFSQCISYINLDYEAIFNNIPGGGGGSARHTKLDM